MVRLFLIFLQPAEITGKQKEVYLPRNSQLKKHIKAFCYTPRLYCNIHAHILALSLQYCIMNLYENMK